MTTYTTYQCTVCRRTKDIANNNTYALINNCTITKGCSGNLYPLGETQVPSNVSSVPGLVNWYPRGTQISSGTIPNTNKQYSLSNSSTGNLELAILMSEQDALSNTSINVIFGQSVTSNIPVIMFSFAISQSTKVFSGADSSGKILRFDQAAINAGLVTVTLNGITLSPGGNTNNYTIQPNVITLNTAISSGVLNVVVATLPLLSQIPVKFIANYSVILGDTSGAWGNISWIDDFVPSGTELVSRSSLGSHQKWWLYTSSALSQFQPSVKLKIIKIMDSENLVDLIPGSLSTDFASARFLLSSSPHQNADRLNQFYADMAVLSEDFNISSAPTNNIEFYIDDKSLVSIYPPFKLYTPPINYQPGVGVAKATQFGSPDGVSTLFRLVDSNGSLIISSAVISAIHRTDWEGRVLLSNQTRTNQCEYSESLMANVSNPTGSWILNGTTSIQAGIDFKQTVPYWSITRNSQSIGIDSGVIRAPCGVFTAATPMFLTIALRAHTTNTVSVGIFDITTGDWGTGTIPPILVGPGTVTQLVGSLWMITGLSLTEDTLLTIQRTATTSDDLMVSVYPGTANPLEYGGDPNIIGQSILATRVMVSSSLGSYIPTNGAPASIIDFTANDSGFIQIQPAPPLNSILDWDGTGTVAKTQISPVSSFVTSDIIDTSTPSPYLTNPVIPSSTKILGPP